MKKLFLILMTIINLNSFSQITRTDETFEKTYTQVRIWEKVDTTWVYSNGSTVEWKFQFNVHFTLHPQSSKMYGAALLDSNNQPSFFLNYLGELIRNKDSMGEYNSQMVDILNNDPLLGRWELVNVGELRHYAETTMLYVGEPSMLLFSYFKLKE